MLHKECMYGFPMNMGYIMVPHVCGIKLVGKLSGGVILRQQSLLSFQILILNIISVGLTETWDSYVSLFPGFGVMSLSGHPF